MQRETEDMNFYTNFYLSYHPYDWNYCVLHSKSKLFFLLTWIVTSAAIFAKWKNIPVEQMKSENNISILLGGKIPLKQWYLLKDSFCLILKY